MEKDQQLNRILELLPRYYNDSLEDEEAAELEQWLDERPENRALFEELKSGKIREDAFRKMDSYDKDAALQKLKRRITKKQSKRRHTMRYSLAAAAVVLFIVTGFLLLKENKRFHSNPRPVAITRHDVPPGTSKARLVLANGKTVPLDSNSATTITQQNGVQVSRQNGALTYSFSGQKSLAVQYNTVIIPRGGEYHITLEDGTKIWLNSASSLRFPTHFSGNERNVRLTGEAFFEVTQKSGTPFIVDVNGTAVKVLGTSFNIQAYPDEHGIKTTLISGAVSVNQGGSRKILKPGEMATVIGEEINISHVDTANIIAWKNGLFRFRETAIPELMKDLARWYDINISYVDNYRVDAHFTGEINRNVPISKVLEMIEKTGVAKFKIENKTIKVYSGISYPQHKKP